MVQPDLSMDGWCNPPYCKSFTARNCSQLTVRYCSVLSWQLAPFLEEEKEVQVQCASAVQQCVRTLLAVRISVFRLTSFREYVSTRYDSYVELCLCC